MTATHPSNPLLQPWSLPPYADIRPEHVLPAVRAVIKSNLRQLALFLPGQIDNPTWLGLVKPLGDLEQRLANVLRPVERLAPCPGQEALREALEQCQGELKSYRAALNYNSTLIGVIGKLQQSAQAAHLDATQRSALNALVARMRLNAAHLAPGSRDRCLVIGEQLLDLYRQFKANLQAGWLQTPDLNTPVIRQILALRAEMASVLGYRSYAQLALTTRAFETPEQVSAMLWGLMERIKPVVVAHVARLKTVAAEDAAQFTATVPGNITDYRRYLRASQYDLDAARLNGYFPALTVLKGLATLVQRLFGVEMRELPSVAGLPASVRLYQLVDADQELGHVYVDLFEYVGKPVGAWMSGVRDRHRFADGVLQLPIAHVSCDFKLETQGEKSLLDVDQLGTLMHEFGHALHHVLTRIEHGSVAGTRGIHGDTLEFPSMLFERWASEPESLILLSGHYQDGHAMPIAVFERYQRYGRYFEALTLHQLVETALVDFELHHLDAGEDFAEAELNILQRTQILESSGAPVSYWLAHAFADDQYAAGYYGYVWSQILASDAFASFHGRSVLDPGIAKRIRGLILETGATLPAVEQISALGGQVPDVESYLKRVGAGF